MRRNRFKVDERKLRRAYLSVLRPFWRTCFWTWPFGHRYNTHADGVRCCDFCFKPYFVGFSKPISALRMSKKYIDDSPMMHRPD